VNIHVEGHVEDSEKVQDSKKKKKRSRKVFAKKVKTERDNNGMT
jgi:hypothetical protein